jgi:hypothetical protein
MFWRKLLLPSSKDGGSRFFRDTDTFYQTARHYTPEDSVLI